jgi:hypothetical protein
MACGLCAVGFRMGTSIKKGLKWILAHEFAWWNREHMVKKRRSLCVGLRDWSYRRKHF